MTKAVVLLSGGLDSTVCLADSVKKLGPDNVHALSFSYGQKHDNEIENAKNVAKEYGVEHVVLTVDPQLFSKSDSTLLKGNGELSHKSYAEIIEENGEGTVDSYVPFRNGLMLSQAAAYAYSIGASKVVYGAHSDDAAGSAYPDCTPEFYKAMDRAIFAGSGHKVNLDAPLLMKNKAGVVTLGLDLGAPLHLTRSCYEGHEDQCGRCGTCIDRVNAFKYNHIVDPVKYENYIDWAGCQSYVYQGGLF